MAASGRRRGDGRRVDLRAATVSRGSAAAPRVYVIIGLVPGRYKVGATDDTNEGPRGWYGGGRSAQEAAVVDVTDADATGIDIDLGRLPATTAPVVPQTTIP